MTDRLDDDEDERTRVASAAPVPPLDDDEDERTRVAHAAQPAAPDDDDSEHTRVAPRPTTSVPDDDEDERTRVNLAKAPSPVEDDDDHTNVAHRDDAGDRTVVSRKAKSSPVLDPTAGTRRRGIAEPPVPQGFAPRAVKAAGAGAVDEYVPRAITPPPPLPQMPMLAPDATRVPSPQLPSVRQRSHRNARRAMIMFVVACVLAVAGAIAIVIAAIEL
jgi:hypothetical protein